MPAKAEGADDTDKAAIALWEAEYLVIVAGPSFYEPPHHTVFAKENCDPLLLQKSADKFYGFWGDYYNRYTGPRPPTLSSCGLPKVPRARSTIVTRVVSGPGSATHLRVCDGRPSPALSGPVGLRKPATLRGPPCVAHRVAHHSGVHRTTTASPCRGKQALGGGPPCRAPGPGLGILAALVSPQTGRSSIWLTTTAGCHPRGRPTWGPNPWTPLANPKGPALAREHGERPWKARGDRGKKGGGRR